MFNDNIDPVKSSKYQDAGVDLMAAEEVVNRYKSEVEKTKINGVIGGLGGFGGLFALKQAAPNIEDPILVSGTDGVGTKLKLAFELNKHDTIGIDLVAMCVNDIATVGARPLFFLDYLATGKLQPEQASEIVGGIAKGCLQAKCALIGGETAEMPGFYKSGEYDVAGFVVGVVDRKKMLPSQNIKEGDLLIGVQSSGFHSNGYSLIRKIVTDQNLDLHTQFSPNSPSLAEALLEPTFIYTQLIESLVNKNLILAASHITGGGLFENVPRVLPENLTAHFDKQSWQVPDIIHYICDQGSISGDERYHVFNMGLGLVLVVAPEYKNDALEIIQTHNFKGYVVGQLVKKSGKNSVIISQ